MTDDADAYFNYACIIEKYKHNYESAAFFLTKALDLNPDDDETKSRLNRVQFIKKCSQTASTASSKEGNQKQLLNSEKKKWCRNCSVCSSKFGTYHLFCNICGAKREYV